VTRIVTGVEDPAALGESKRTTAVQSPATSCEPGTVRAPHWVVLALADAGRDAVRVTPARVSVSVHFAFETSTSGANASTSAVLVEAVHPL
jgi:hypothetical protein